MSEHSAEIDALLAPHHSACVQREDGTYVCDPLCPDPHGGARCGYVIPPRADRPTPEAPHVDR